MGARTMERHTTRTREPGMLISYDLETTLIAAGTPSVRYFTAYDGHTLVSCAISDTTMLATTIIALCTSERANARFVAWNGNRFDARFIANALIEYDATLEIHPYLTRSHTLRGFHITINGCRYFFYDGIAMTGMVGTSLADFLALYAPNLQKLSFDFEHVAFDATNADHVAYAERDSIGLWHGMTRCEQIVRDITGAPLAPTIGNVGVKYLMSQMPAGKTVFPPNATMQRAIYGSLLRGGYCWCAQQSLGATDKYDINQAYAAAMRDTTLPCGPTSRVRTYQHGLPGMYLVTIQRAKPLRAPFYVRDADTGTPRFTHGAMVHAWITSDEYALLVEYGWQVSIEYGWIWEDTFDLSAMVSVLEQRRMTCPGGPSGPEGRMLKAIGNNAYGKTLERLDGIDFVLSATEPDGYKPFHAEDETLRYVWYREGTEYSRPYHQPQIGAFITAAVRCKVLRVAWQAGERFIYADTDCVMLRAGTTFPADIHPSRYGAWKVEGLSAQYMVLAKKVYVCIDDRAIHAKGLRTRQLTMRDMWDWWNGKPPRQIQTQLQQFWRLTDNVSMFRDIQRSGTDANMLQSVYLDDERRMYAVNA